MGARTHHAGFSLIELLLALTIAGLVMAAAVPATRVMYSAMQYQSALQDITTLLGDARLKAISKGRAQDVLINPEKRELRSGDKTLRLPSSIKVTVESARQLNRDDAGVIRFYPQGDSSGGTIALRRAGGAGANIVVDWLLGNVRVQTHDEQAS